MSFPTPHPEETPARPQRIWAQAVRRMPRLALGLFILWQVSFLVLHNTRDFLMRAQKDNYEAWAWLRRTFPRRKDKISKVLYYAKQLRWEETEKELRDELADKSRKHHLVVGALRGVQWWERRLAQEQNWSLFAPNVVDWTCFPAVELLWDDDQILERQVARSFAVLGATDPLQATLTLAVNRFHQRPQSVKLLSENEPRNKESYLRVGKMRLRKFEGAFDIPLRLHGCSRQEAITENNGWNYRVRRMVWRSRREIHVYLRWRMQQYLQAHPDVSVPTQVRLWIRTWSIRPPDSRNPYGWHEESEELIARWVPTRAVRENGSPVEHFDLHYLRFRQY